MNTPPRKIHGLALKFREYYQNWRSYAHWILLFLAIFTVTGSISLMHVIMSGDLLLLPSLGSALIVVLPFILLPPRFRWTVLIPAWLIAVFFESNVLYWRFTDDFIPLHNFFMVRNFGAVTFKAGLALVKAADIVLFLPAIAITSIYLLWLRKPAADPSSRFAAKPKMIILAASVLCFICSEIWHTGYLLRTIKTKKLSLNEVIRSKYDFTEVGWSAGQDYRFSGFATYLIKGGVRELYFACRSRKLNAPRRSTLIEFWDRHDAVKKQLPDSIASLFARNREKNLIFIVVESLNAKAVSYRYGSHRLMPILSGLMDADGSISTVEMVPQIRSGLSSDGQLILNTGLYPASDCTTAWIYGTNDFPSLAKMLKKSYSFEAIWEPEHFWNHHVTTKSYGYDALVSDIRKSAQGQKKGKDGVLFDTSLAIMDTIPHPFFALITTMSMHAPFSEKVQRPEWISDIPDIPDMMRKYLTVCHYFDTELGKFIDELKRRDIYDHSVIVIASDHDAPVDGMTGPQGSNRIVFAASNTGFTSKIEHPAGQVDAFPTILEIMGRSDGYTGMGISMLNSDNTGAVDKNGRITGGNITPRLDSLLRSTSNAANIMHRTNFYRHP